MNTITGRHSRWYRPTALLLSASLMMPILAGCGGHKDEATMAPVDDTRGGKVTPNAPTEEKHGMSTTKKVVLLAGAAAVYYWYTHHKKAEENPDKQQYYLSKSTGRIYYRDKDHRAHWVTPPQDKFEVPEDEAKQYSRFKGYDNKQTGDDLSSVADGDQ